MFAIISAVLFAIALVVELVADIARFRLLGTLFPYPVFVTAGLLCLALEVAGVWRRRGAETGSRRR